MRQAQIFRLLLWLLPLIVVALSLRLVNLSSWFYYTFDEEVISYVARRVVFENHYPLIGGITPLRFHLGPLFYLFSTFWLWVGGMNPVIGWGILTAILTTLTVVLVYILGRMMFSQVTGLFAAIFMATSYLMVIMDRHYWPLTLNPLLTSVVLISLIMIEKGRKYFIWPLIFSLIFGSQMDPSAFVLIVLVAVVWLVRKLPTNNKSFKGASLLLLLSNLPLLAFELRHNFYNSRSFLSFFSQPANNLGFRVDRFIDTLELFPRTLARLVWPFEPLDVMTQLTFCKSAIIERFSAADWFILPAGIFLLVWFIYLWRNRKQSIGQMVCFLLLGIVFIGINLYSNLFNADLYEQYLTPAFPVLFLGLGWAAGWVWKRNRLAACSLIILVVLINTKALFSGVNRFGWQDKWQAVNFAIEKVGDKPFHLDALGSCYRYGGFRYIFSIAGKEPATSYVDHDLGYLYSKKLDEKRPSLNVVMVSPEANESKEFMEKYNDYLANVVSRKNFGSLEVLISDNLRMKEVAD